MNTTDKKHSQLLHLRAYFSSVFSER